MAKIVKKELLAEKIYLMDVEAPLVAASCSPGQFIIVKIDEKGERIPLTIADYDREKGLVTIVFQEVGASTLRLRNLEEGDEVETFVGPLGRASDFVTEPLSEVSRRKYLFVAGGVGTAPVYPQVKWLKEHGIGADVIIGARNKDLIFFEDRMEEAAEHVYIATDDGSYGFHGNVVAMMQKLFDEGHEYDICVAIGPLVMMKFVCELTKKTGLKTIVSMNPIMVDGTGMCGACRLQVGDKVKFACVDGPEFDGHLVDFDQAMMRSRIYKTEEGRAYLKAKEGDTHSGNCGVC